MNWIISSIQSLPMASSPASADPNVMIMYFISSLPLIRHPERRTHNSVGAVARFSTSATTVGAWLLSRCGLARKPLGRDLIDQREVGQHHHNRCRPAEDLGRQAVDEVTHQLSAR